MALKDFDRRIFRILYAANEQCTSHSPPFKPHPIIVELTTPCRSGRRRKSKRREFAIRKIAGRLSLIILVLTLAKVFFELLSAALALWR